VFDDREEDGDGEEDGGCAGLGEVAKSIVAAASLLTTDAPHDEQKRTASACSEPHEKHLAMDFPATGYLRL